MIDCFSSFTKRICCFFAFSVCLFGGNALHGQDIGYAHRVLDTLCSKTMFGRCCSQKGDSIAAEFIAGEFKKNKLLSFTENYKQAYTLKCNEIADVCLALHHPDSVLQAGEDYVVSGTSPSVDLVLKNEKTVCFGTLNNWENFKKKEKLHDKVLVFDAHNVPYSSLSKKILPTLDEVGAIPKLIIFRNNSGHLLFPSGRRKDKFPVLLLKENLLPAKKKIDYLELKIEAVFHDPYPTQNVTAYVKGKTYPDSFFVFIAHYDHLGGMGKEVYFPGANDNASSVCLLLDLAAYYAKPQNQPEYSILFISTSGEELGLLGATYYAEHPQIPLSAIKFLINMDMNGTGSGGFHLVHGLLQEKAATFIEKKNTENYYFTKIAKGGEANNSDHYPFHQKSVPCLFVFTSGCEYNEYHSMHDKASELPFTKYESVFRLMTDFVREYR